MTILVTGGAGYIGSHVIVELLNTFHEIVVIDNLSNSSKIAIDRVSNITNKNVSFYEGDILDTELLNFIFLQHNITAVVHFAGLKSVSESVEKPLIYYHNNVSGTITLCDVMGNHGCKNLIFSSSATVYGDPVSLPITEDVPLSTTNPYGASKLMVEEILTDLYNSDDSWNITCLRYFNPVGAHESGLIGEDPNDIPNNLVPFISQVCIGKLDKLAVFGNDYDTKDGTGLRDYIHVVDLALGHLAALNNLKKSPGLLKVNLGTGQGYTVFEMIKAFEQISGKSIPFEIVPRRSGDIASCYSSPSLAKKLLDWEAKFTLHDMVASSWKWQSKNPNGYN